MSAVASPDDPTALATRVWLLEQEGTRNGDKLARVDDRVSEHGEVIAVHTSLLAGLREDVISLKGSVDRAVWGLVGLCFTIAGSSGLIAHFAG